MAFTTESIFNSVMGAIGLNAPINKGTGPRTGNSAVEPDFLRLPEYQSDLNDDEIIDLTNSWKERYMAYMQPIQRKQGDNEKYWLGHQYNPLESAGTVKRVLVDNAVFEALETFIPMATQMEPDPVVISEQSEEGDEFSNLVKDALSWQADRQQLRMKLKPLIRLWALDFLSCAKIRWGVNDIDDTTKNDIVTDIVRTKRLILDPDAYIEVNGKYRGEYLGEVKRLSAGQLAKMFPHKKEVIMQASNGNPGAILTPIEWWTSRDLFWTLGTDAVLGKFKNPTWNWDGTVEMTDPEDPDHKVKKFVKGRNHFDQPEIPFIFFTVFNTGAQPHDETNLIDQVIPLQDNLNERRRQIEQNIKRVNNGVALNGLYFTKEQASQALSQIMNGGGLWVPNNEKMQGRMDDAFRMMQMDALPAQVFETADKMQERLVGIFGTSGSTPTGIARQQDVRGKILASQADSSRIGGGITQFLEQWCDTWYNWQIQMMMVNYDMPHFVAALGDAGAEKISTLSAQQFDKPLIVTVKEGSMVPKDPLTKRNEAMDLWSANAIGLPMLYKRLDWADPMGSAEQTLLWQLIQEGKAPPQLLFPNFPGTQPEGVPQEMPGTGGPAVNPTAPGQNVSDQAPEGAQPPESAESKQLIDAIPLR